MIYLINLSGPFDLEHDLADPSPDPSDLYHALPCLLSDLSYQYNGLSVRSMWYIMIYLIYLSDLVDVDHDLPNISVRSIWYIMIYLIYLSDLVDVDHDLPNISVRLIWSDLSVQSI